MKGKYLINNMKEIDKDKDITVLVTFSRRVFVPFFFSALNGMLLPRKKMHLLVYDNSEDVQLAEALTHEVNRLSGQYKSIRLYKSYLKGRGNIRGSGNEQFENSKLWNIWHMWIDVFKSKKPFIQTKTFFMLEDDTIPPPDAFRRLWKTYTVKKEVSMVTAIATGRSPYPWTPARLGVHHVFMKGKKLMKRVSLSPFNKGLKEVDGCGVYCFVADLEAFLTGFDGYDPVSFKVPFFAMDNVLTWNMCQHGYKILADFDVWCSHLQASSARIIAFSKDQAVQMADIWILEFNNYAQAVEIKTEDQRNRRFRVRKPAPSWEI